ncbi:MAG: hypothetical protein ACJ8LG_19360 [Massilia sp.]
MRDHPHISTDGSEVCAHCGQPLRAAEPTYGDKGSSRTGLIVTILLHLLLVAIYLFQPKMTRQKSRPPAGGAIVYISPLPSKPKAKPAEQAPKKSAKVTPKKKSAPERIQVQRLPNTITLPDEKPDQVAKAAPTKEAPQEIDMQAAIEARRRARGAPTPSEPAPESDDARGMRNALANIAAINGRSRDDSNESGGVFSVSNKTFHSMDLKFRGWNPSFKRRWLTQLTVEQGGERDVETAVVKKMIELIRKEKTGDFEWDSHRLGRVITMSARPQDTAELQAFLYKEMFPEYKPGR